MSYPESADVSSGDATLAEHYNDLRADALRFGQAAADAVNVGSMIDFYEKHINLIPVGTDQVRVEASATKPVAMMIDGHPVRAVANVTLAASVISGAAAKYYIFAVRSSATFTLTARKTSAPGTDERLIGSCYWDAAAIVDNSIYTQQADDIIDLINFYPALAAQGRLSLLTATPETTSDITGATTLYYTQCTGRTLGLYAPGWGWTPHSIGELSISFAGSAASKHHDIFAYDVDGTITLEKVAWSTDLVRVTALTLQDGIPVKNGEPHKRYLGSARTDAASQLEDSENNRNIFNAYNRVPRPMAAHDSAWTWTYNSPTHRQANNRSEARVSFSIGLPTSVFVLYSVGVAHATAFYYADVGLYLDKTSGAPTIMNRIYNIGASAAVPHHGFPVTYNKTVPAGYHYLQASEADPGSATMTFYQANSADHIYGLRGFVLS